MTDPEDSHQKYLGQKAALGVLNPDEAVFWRDVYATSRAQGLDWRFCEMFADAAVLGLRERLPKPPAGGPYR